MAIRFKKNSYDRVKNRVGYTRIYACGQVGTDSLGRSRKQTLWKLLLVEW